MAIRWRWPRRGGCRAGLSKPLLACWMGDERVAPGRQLIAQSGLANFRTPEAAVDGFSNIAVFYQNQQLLQQTPPPLSQLAKPDLERAPLVESVLAERRSMLTEMESRPCWRPSTSRSRHHAGAQRSRSQLICRAAGLPGGAENRFARHQHKSMCRAWC
jgi:acyl-CoA synthetase (NDP forming)